MGRYASDTGGGDFQQAPVGNHRAVAIRLIDLGTQVGEYQGKATKRNQVLLSWELADELMETEHGMKPFIVSKFYTNSLGEKANLRKDLVQWRGREFSPEELAKFDLQSILGKPCLVSVIHNDKGKARVAGVAKLPKGMDPPQPVNDVFAFWLDEFDSRIYESLGDGLKKIISASPEYMELGKPRSQPATGGGFDDDNDDDIPF